MVAFTCNTCGESVKKNKAEKHLMQCSGCSLSCMDCGQNFYGDSYNSHTKCITEAEKYQGKLFQAKDKINKGEKKQQDWIKNLQSMSSSSKSTNPQVNAIIDKIVTFENIPRKKKKFINFMKNSAKVYNDKLLDEVWELFAASTKEPQSPEDPKRLGNTVAETTNSKKQESVVLSKNYSTDNIVKKKTKKEKKQQSSSKESPQNVQKDDKIDTHTKAKKRKLADCDKDKSELPKKKKLMDKDSSSINSTKKRKKQSKMESKSVSHNGSKSVVESDGKAIPNDKFNWKKTITRVVKSTEDGNISLKRLKKKVFAILDERGNNCSTTSAVDRDELFTKWINKCKKIKVDGRQVCLLKRCT